MDKEENKFFILTDASGSTREGNLFFREELAQVAIVKDLIRTKKGYDIVMYGKNSISISKLLEDPITQFAYSGMSIEEITNILAHDLYTGKKQGFDGNATMPSTSVQFIKPDIDKENYIIVVTDGEVDEREMTTFRVSLEEKMKGIKFHFFFCIVCNKGDRQYEELNRFKESVITNIEGNVNTTPFKFESWFQPLPSAITTTSVIVVFETSSSTEFTCYDAITCMPYVPTTLKNQEEIIRETYEKLSNDRPGFIMYAIERCSNKANDRNATLHEIATYWEKFKYNGDIIDFLCKNVLGCSNPKTARQELIKSVIESLKIFNYIRHNFGIFTIFFNKDIEKFTIAHMFDFVGKDSNYKDQLVQCNGKQVITMPIYIPKPNHELEEQVQRILIRSFGAYLLSIPETSPELIIFTVFIACVILNSVKNMEQRPENSELNKIYITFANSLIINIFKKLYPNSTITYLYILNNQTKEETKYIGIRTELSWLSRRLSIMLGFNILNFICSTFDTNNEMLNYDIKNIVKCLCFANDQTQKQAISTVVAHMYCQSDDGYLCCITQEPTANFKCGNCKCGFTSSSYKYVCSTTSNEHPCKLYELSPKITNITELNSPTFIKHSLAEIDEIFEAQRQKEIKERMDRQQREKDEVKLKEHEKNELARRAREAEMMIMFSSGELNDYDAVCLFMRNIPNMSDTEREIFQRLKTLNLHLFSADKRINKMIQTIIICIIKRIKFTIPIKDIIAHQFLTDMRKTYDFL